jgi:hypothetical protein
VVWTVLVVIGRWRFYLLRTVLLVLASPWSSRTCFPLVKPVERPPAPGARRPPRSAWSTRPRGRPGHARRAGRALGSGRSAALGQRFPEISAQIQSGRVISQIFPGWGGAEILDEVIRAHLPQVVEYAQHGLAGALSFLSGAWVVIMVPIFAFFFLRDAERVADAVTGAIDDQGGWRGLSKTIVARSAQRLRRVRPRPGPFVC